MKIALIGFGKMGREIEAVAREQGDTIACVFEIDHVVRPEALADVDVCIDFSTPAAILDNIRAVAAAGKDMVVGTTGWHEHLPEVKMIVQTSGLLYSSNFSLGVNLFFRIVARAAELMNKAPDYDLFVHECHHNQKVDSPSGTALRLSEILLAGIDRKTEVLADSSKGKIHPNVLHVSSTRVGYAVGEHVVAFDSLADVIELRHVARSRRGFALGALTAARWLQGRKGVFTMDDVDL